MSVQHFFAMGGYAQYVWGSYASVFILLTFQLILPWKRWRKYLRDQFSHE